MKALMVLGAMLLSAAAAATQTSPSGPGADEADPNGRVCKATREIGSRLGRTRTCLTPGQWAERRSEVRETIDGAQVRQVNRVIDEKGRIDAPPRRN